MKQVAAGTDIVKKTLDAFSVPTVATTVLLDVHGYDAFPSLCALEELAAGRTTLCGTIVLDMPGDELVSRIGNQVYSLARSDKLSVPSFPKFEPIIQGLREGTSEPEERPAKRIKLEDGTAATKEEVAQLTHILAINNACELVTGNGGDALFIVSSSRNQFLLHREMRRAC
ncbi:unnamed protein product [Effrenium voratum]|nr:unnamed protein product [Effrenium voratum]